MNQPEAKVIKYLEITRLLEILERDIETELDEEKRDIYKQIYEAMLDI